MSYNVEISKKAETQYEKILYYVSNTLKNEQAVISIMDDFDDAITTLERMADSFEYCRSNRLKKLGLRKLRLSKHNYLLIYRIIDNQVIIEGMYHELQDYEKSF